MSNSQVGAVYSHIINDVIDASRLDFEEGGVEEGVVDKLRNGWQKKLTQLQLATFPWDPRPDPPPAPATASATPQPAPGSSTPLSTSNGNGFSQSQQTAHQPVPVPMPTGHSTGDPRVKTEPTVKIEPGLEGSQMPQISASGDLNNIAQQRVIAQLQNQYGDRAAASINKLREQPGVGVSQPQTQQRIASPSMPQGYPAQYQSNGQQQYRPSASPNPAAPPQRVPLANGQRPSPSQVDGAGDDIDQVGILVRQFPNGDATEMGRAEIDELFHAQLAARANSVEGGDRMSASKRKRSPLSKGSNPKRESRQVDGEEKWTLVRVKRESADREISQFDGEGGEVVGEGAVFKEEDDNVSDADAINSDLDDSDENIEENEEDDESGHIMLCMYDKVQRVKNKWKCVLKDGILTVNGKDYVFHKATGEYEW